MQKTDFFTWNWTINLTFLICFKFFDKTKTSENEIIYLQIYFGLVSPMIWVPNQLVGAPAGTDVTIDCHTEAYPRAISYWVYDNVMLLPTKKYGTETAENSYRAHMKLSVRNLQPGDFGNYRCISKNSLGETEGSIRLYGK